MDFKRTFSINNNFIYFAVPTTSESSVATAAIVAGVLVTLVVLTVVGLIIGYFCWKAKCKKEKVEPRKGLPPTSTGMPSFLSHHMDSGKPQGFHSMKREPSNSTLLSDSRANLILTPSTLHPNYISKHDALEIPVPLDANKGILPPLGNLDGSQLSLLHNDETAMTSRKSKGHTKKKKKGTKTKKHWVDYLVFSWHFHAQKLCVKFRVCLRVFRRYLSFFIIFFKFLIQLLLVLMAYRCIRLRISEIIQCFIFRFTITSLSVSFSCLLISFNSALTCWECCSTHEIAFYVLFLLHVFFLCHWQL